MTRFYFLLAALLSSIVAAAQPGTPTSASPYDSARFSLFRPVPRNQLRDMKPDRPGVTESPFTVDAGHLQIETDLLRLVNERDEDKRERTWRASCLNVKLGLSRRTDVQLELPLYTVRKERPAGETAWERHAGFGDVALRLKHNFIGNDQESPVAFAAIPYVRLPTGGQAGHGSIEGGLVLPVDFRLAEKWDLEVQLESDLNYDRDAARHYVRLMPSVAIERDLTDKLELLLEAVTQWDALHSGWRTSLNAAPVFKVTDNFQVDLGAHFALHRHADQEYFVGFSFRH